MSGPAFGVSWINLLGYASLAVGHLIVRLGVHHALEGIVVVLVFQGVANLVQIAMFVLDLFDTDADIAGVSSGTPIHTSRATSAANEITLQAGLKNYM